MNDSLKRWIFKISFCFYKNISWWWLIGIDTDDLKIFSKPQYSIFNRIKRCSIWYILVLAILPFFPFRGAITVPRVVLFVLLLILWFPVNAAGVVPLLPPAQEKGTEEHTWQSKLLDNIPKPLHNYFGPCLFSNRLLNRPDPIMPFQYPQDTFPSLPLLQMMSFPLRWTCSSHTPVPKLTAVGHHDHQPLFLAPYESNLNEFILFYFTFLFFFLRCCGTRFFSERFLSRKLRHIVAEFAWDVSTPPWL